MKALLKAADLPQSQFLELFRNTSESTSLRRVWLEAPDGWAFDWWQSSDDSLEWRGAGRQPSLSVFHECLARSTTGRVFNAEGELRWRRIPGLGPSCWRTVFLGDRDWVGCRELEDHSNCLDSLQPQRKRLYLWGQQTPNSPDEWIDLRIPHRFRYPILGNGHHVRLLVEQWHDEGGEPHFVRWCDLEPYSEVS